MGAEDAFTLQRDLGRMEGKLDMLIARLDRRDSETDESIEAVDKKATDAHARISKVEKRLAYYVGISTAIVFIISHAPQWLGLIK